MISRWILFGLIVWPASAAEPLRVVVLEGDGAINNIRLQRGKEPVVRVGKGRVAHKQVGNRIASRPVKECSANEAGDHAVIDVKLFQRSLIEKDAVAAGSGTLDGQPSQMDDVRIRRRGDGNGLAARR